MSLFALRSFLLVVRLTSRPSRVFLGSSQVLAISRNAGERRAFSPACSARTAPIAVLRVQRRALSASSPAHRVAVARASAVLPGRPVWSRAALGLAKREVVGEVQAQNLDEKRTHF